MNYMLVRSSTDDIERLIEFKKKTIYEYAKNLSEKEVSEINNYVLNHVPKVLDNYFNVVVNNEIIGCVLLTDVDDGKLLDEIYILEDYRNRGIGTDIIKKIISDNSIVYLWVYKENVKAISLYKRLGFDVIDETDLRFYMKYFK